MVNSFESCFFLDGTSESRIQADMIRNVRALGTEHSQKSFKDCLAFLAQAPSNRTRLIVYDNVDDPDLDLVSLMPPGDSCAIIVTSRNHSVGELDQKGHLELDVMSMPEAVELLRHDDPRLTEQDATAIAQELGCLAIALTQARSYIFQTRCSGAAYLDRLKSSRDKLLARPVKHQRDMRYTSTYAAFDASFEKLDVWAQRLLRLLSFLHWSKIPLELIVLAAKHHFADYERRYIEHGETYHAGKALLEEIFLREGEWDITDLDEMMVSIQSYSLASLSPGVDTLLLQMHPLAHGWINSYISQNDRISYQSAAIVLLALGSRDEYTPSAQYLASHVTHLSPLWDKLQVNEAERLGRILYEAGYFQGALRLRERVVRELERQPDLDKPTLSQGQWDLAMAYRDLGQFDRAEVLQVAVLRITTEAFGPHHHKTLTISNGLALTYRALGRLKEALELQAEVLKLMKESHGERHPDTISASNNLALSYQILGRLQEAEELQVEVPRLRKEMFGERHPDTIEASNNLATTYHYLGRLAESEELKTEVLRLRKEILGDRHYDTITVASDLSVIYSSLGRKNEAEELQIEVLRLRKEIIGERHPDTIRASNNLANTYYSTDRFNEAASIQAGALNLLLEVLGEGHVDSAMTMFNLAQTYRKLGDQRQCLDLLTRAKGAFLKALGPNHPYYQRCENVLLEFQRDSGSEPGTSS